MIITRETFSSIDETVQKIKDLAYKYAPEVRLLAMKLTQNLPRKDLKAEQNAVIRYVKEYVRYIMDIRDVETLQSPLITLGLKYPDIHQGDCDDHTCAGLSLLWSIGHDNIYPITISMRPDGLFDHIFLISDDFILDSSERDIIPLTNLITQLPEIYPGITGYKIWKN